MNSILEEILRTGYSQSANRQLIKVHSQIPREEGAFLQEIISEVKPQVSLEVGLAYGISALFIKVCRFIVTNRAYSVFGCLEARFSKLAFFEYQLYSLKQRLVCMKLDPELGLVPNSRCIAFKKEAEDTRLWNFHQDF
jgi:hypothetical protein